MGTRRCVTVAVVVGLGPLGPLGAMGCGTGGGAVADSGPAADGGDVLDAADAPDGRDAAPDAGEVGDAGWRPEAGSVLFAEPFEDTSFGVRGWYDGSSGTLSTAEHAPGASTAAFECTFVTGATGCSGGTPARHRITATETAYVRMWIKFSTNWVGSGRAYHPHMFHFTTDVDGDWIGPAGTHLTTYVEVVGGVPTLALQDLLNVDPNCILRNDDTFVGCSGNFATYPFTEMRSVASCNGLVGDLDGRDCFASGAGWYSARMWRAPGVYFQSTPGPYYQADWHQIEAYFQMNTIQAGVGVPDGRIRFWYDGMEIIGYDHVLLRTAANAALAFDHFLMLPYIGDGSPVTQTFWIDDLVVATGLVP